MTAPITSTTLDALRHDMLLHGWREPVTPRPAATILLLRDGQGGLELLMTRRSATASFAPGAYVFPGGALDATDAADAALTASRARPDQDDAERHFAAAALREAFEELGVLLAWERGTDRPCRPDIVNELDRSHDGDLYAQLGGAGLELALDQTGWLSHWITDRDLPKRFDVRFFVAPMPAGQHAVADGAEQFEPVWVNPGDALRRHEQGSFSMIFPTIRTLRQLERFADAASLLNACRNQSARFTSCPRGGRIAGKDVRFTEDEMAFGELELVAPDGRVVHDLDWQHERPVPLRRNLQRLTAPNPSMMTGPGTNTYIVGEASRFIVIDPGPALPTHIERLAAAVGDGLQAIVCTHSHPDHSPGAPLLREAVGYDVPILGLASLPTARAHSSFQPDRELADGETLRVGASTLRVIHTPGHAANHLCLLLEEDRLLFSGDHVLPTITPSIGFTVPPDDQPLGHFMASLTRVRQLPDLRILPAHGPVADSTHARVDELLAHHDTRLDQCRAALASGPATAHDVAGHLGWTRHEHRYDSLDPFSRGMAAMETKAHLDLLVARGEARDEPRADGVRYTLLPR